MESASLDGRFTSSRDLTGSQWHWRWHCLPMVYPAIARGREGKAMAIQSLSGQGRHRLGIAGEAIHASFWLHRLFGGAASLCLFACNYDRDGVERCTASAHASPPRARKMPVLTSALIAQSSVDAVVDRDVLFGFAIRPRKLYRAVRISPGNASIAYISRFTEWSRCLWVERLTDGSVWTRTV